MWREKSGQPTAGYPLSSSGEIGRPSVCYPKQSYNYELIESHSINQLESILEKR